MKKKILLLTSLQILFNTIHTVINKQGFNLYANSDLKSLAQKYHIDKFDNLYPIKNNWLITIKVPRHLEKDIYDKILSKNLKVSVFDFENDTHQNLTVSHYIPHSSLPLAIIRVEENISTQYIKPVSALNSDDQKNVNNKENWVLISGNQYLPEIHDKYILTNPSKENSNFAVLKMCKETNTTTSAFNTIGKIQNNQTYLNLNETEKEHFYQWAAQLNYEREKKHSFQTDHATIRESLHLQKHFIGTPEAVDAGGIFLLTNVHIKSSQQKNKTTLNQTQNNFSLNHTNIYPSENFTPINLHIEKVKPNLSPINTQDNWNMSLSISISPQSDNDNLIKKLSEIENFSSPNPSLFNDFYIHASINEPTKPNINLNTSYLSNHPFSCYNIQNHVLQKTLNDNLKGTLESTNTSRLLNQTNINLPEDTDTGATPFEIHTDELNSENCNTYQLILLGLIIPAEENNGNAIINLANNDIQEWIQYATTQDEVDSYDSSYVPTNENKTYDENPTDENKTYDEKLRDEIDKKIKSSMKISPNIPILKQSQGHRKRT